jgi:hypothetical protein
MTRSEALELIRLAGDLETHLDDTNLDNVHGVMGHVVNRLLELAAEEPQAADD